MHRLNLLLSGAIVASFIPSPAATAEEPRADDSKAILGHWQCTVATFKNEPFPEYVGTIYWFKDDGELEIQGSDSWSRWKYRLDITKKPKELATSWAGGKDVTEIYELTTNQLRIRSVDDPQPLSFDRQPQGKWNESIFKRITTAEAQAQIEKLKKTPVDE